MKLLPLLLVALLALVPLAFVPALSFQVRVGRWSCFGHTAGERVRVGTVMVA